MEWIDVPQPLGKHGPWSRRALLMAAPAPHAGYTGLKT